MRALAIVLCIASTVSAAAFGAPPRMPSMPAPAAEILDRLDKEIAQAKAKAITALDKVMKETTKKGDLNGAIAVKQALDRLHAETIAIGATSRLGQGPTFAGRWQGPSYTVQAFPNGTATASNGMKGTWTTNGPRVEIAWEGGVRHQLQATPTGYAGSRLGADGSSTDLVYTRITD